MERVRNVPNECRAVAPLDFGYLFAVGDMRHAGQYLARDVDDRSPGRRMYPFAEAPDGTDRQAGLFEGLSDRRILCGLSWLDLPCWELPGQLAFGDSASDEQHLPVGDDHGRSNDRLTHALVSYLPVPCG